MKMRLLVLSAAIIVIYAVNVLFLERLLLRCHLE